MKQYTIIGTYSGGETYYECVEAESVPEAITAAFNPKEEEEAPPETVIAVIEGHHKEVGLSAYGFIYPMTEHDEEFQP